MKNTKEKYLPYCHPPKRNYQKEILRKKVCKEKKNENKKDILSSKKAKKWQKTPFLGQNFCANEFAASKNPNSTMIWGISFRAIFDQKRPKNGIKRPKNGKRRQFLHQWIFIVENPQYYHYLEDHYIQIAINGNITQ